MKHEREPYFQDCIGCGRVTLDALHAPPRVVEKYPHFLQGFAVLQVGNMLRHVCEHCDPILIRPEELERRAKLRAERDAEMDPKNWPRCCHNCGREGQSLVLVDDVWLCATCNTAGRVVS